MIKFIVIALTISIVISFVLIALFQRSLLFPIHAIPAIESEVPVNAETWFTETENPVEVWFLPGTGDEPKKPTVFFAHGNGGLIDHFPVALRPYRELGFHVVLIEYRGYGRSKGSPSEDAIVADYVRVYDQIITRKDVDASQILFHGQSLGGGVISGLAKQREPTLLFLESTFTSVRDIANGLLPMGGLLIRDPFMSKTFVESTALPILLMHGTADGVIPFPHGEALSKLAKNGTFIPVDGGGHMLPWNAQYWEHVRTFVAPIRSADR